MTANMTCIDVALSVPTNWNNTTGKPPWNFTEDQNQTSESCSEIPEDAKSIEDKVASVLGLLFTYAVYPSGLVTNTLSFLVMNMKQNRKSPICVQMSILAVCDNIVVAREFFTAISDAMNLYPVTKGLCKYLVYSHHFLTGFSAYTIAGMTFNRFNAIVFPHKTNIFCSKKRVGVYSLIIFILTAVCYCPLIFTTSLRVPSLPPLWCTRFASDAWYIDIYAIFLIVFYPTVPMISLLFFNIAIIRALFMRHQLTTSQTSSRKSKERQITLMLLLVSFLFIILVLPFEIYDIFQMSGHFLVPDTLFQLMMSNSCINFYLYLLSGSKFRSDLKMLFKCNKPMSEEDSHNQRSTSTEHTPSESQPTVSSVS